MKVQRNVATIAISFLIRFVYDLVKVVYDKWFDEMREKSYKRSSWYYPAFFFLLSLLVDFIPSLMFVYNLKYIWDKGIVVSKKMYVDSPKKSSWSTKDVRLSSEEKDDDVNDLDKDKEEEVLSYDQKKDSLIGDYN